MKRTILTLAIAVMGIAASAQTELSGKWKRDSQESISGTLYVNGTPEMMIIGSDKKELNFERTYVAGENTATVKDMVKLDGKDSESVTASKRRKVMSYKKEGDKVTVVAVLYSASEPNKIDKRVTDVMTIVDAQLVLDRKDENLVNGETWQARAVYVKQ